MFVWLSTGCVCAAASQHIENAEQKPKKGFFFSRKIENEWKETRERSRFETGTHISTGKKKKNEK